MRKNNDARSVFVPRCGSAPIIVFIRSTASDNSHPHTLIYIQELPFTAYIYRRRGRQRAQLLLSGSPAPEVSALMSEGQMRGTSGERTWLRITPSKGDGDRRRFREEWLGATSTEVKGEAIILGCAHL